MTIRGFPDIVKDGAAKLKSEEADFLNLEDLTAAGARDFPGYGRVSMARHEEE